MKPLSPWYLLCPAATLALVVPMIMGLPPLAIPSNFNWFQVAIATPFWLGILAAPGYIYAWAGHYDRTALSSIRQRWVGSSLILALVATIGGLISALTVIAIPTELGSIICASLMLRRFFRPRQGQVLHEAS